MGFDYVWGIIESCVESPNARQFTELKSEYKFYPLQHEGAIFTADSTFWRNETIAKVNYWPSTNEIAHILLSHKLENHLLVILSDNNSASTIDPNTLVKLSKIPVDVKKSFEFVDAGFDVIDISGLSALTNIGYASADLSTLDNNLKVTQYGLIASISEARKFANFASNVAPEHSPFFTVKVNLIEKQA